MVVALMLATSKSIKVSWTEQLWYGKTKVCQLITWDEAVNRTEQNAYKDKWQSLDSLSTKLSAMSTFLHLENCSSTTSTRFSGISELNNVKLFENVVKKQHVSSTAIYKTL